VAARPPALVVGDESASAVGLVVPEGPRSASPPLIASTLVGAALPAPVNPRALVGGLEGFALGDIDDERTQAALLHRLPRRNAATRRLTPSLDHFKGSQGHDILVGQYRDKCVVHAVMSFLDYCVELCLIDGRLREAWRDYGFDRFGHNDTLDALAVLFHLISRCSRFFPRFNIRCGDNREDTLGSGVFVGTFVIATTHCDFL